MVRLRLDRRLKGRIDPSDVLQEAYVEALERFPDYLAEPDMPFFLWLRFLTVQRLVTMHRRHLHVRARDAGREQPPHPRGLPEASSAILAAEFVTKRTSPSQAAMRAEMQRRLQAALDEMDPMDREVLALRHFEQLTNGETAQVLGLRPTAASQRYVRAVMRLKAILTGTAAKP
jgi:RNA polymerase sigma-70 factor (ECF subfamily)